MSEQTVAVQGGDLFLQMGELPNQDPVKMTGEELAQMINAKIALIGAFKKFELERDTRVGQGILVPGFTMRPGKGSKKWNCDDATVQKRLTSLRLKKADCWPASIISPAKMLAHPDLTKAQKAKLAEDLISTIVGTDVMTAVEVGSEAERQEKPKKDLRSMFTNVKQKNTLVEQPKKKLSFRKTS